MPRCTVIWLVEAETQLAAIWLAASDRNAVTSAQAKIDTELSVDPIDKCIRVAEGLYKIVVNPLSVYCEVNQSDRKVVINAVACGN